MCNTEGEGEKEGHIDIEGEGDESNPIPPSHHHYLDLNTKEQDALIKKYGDRLANEYIDILGLMGHVLPYEEMT